jgi:hypothetical protein
MTLKFTDTYIKRLRSKEKREEKFEGSGFGIMVYPTGSKTSRFCRKSQAMSIISSLKPRQGYSMISFKQPHFKKEMILMLVGWYVAYPMSYRDIEELVAERN